MCFLSRPAKDLEKKKKKGNTIALRVASHGAAVSEDSAQESKDFAGPPREDGVCKSVTYIAVICTKRSIYTLRFCHASCHCARGEKTRLRCRLATYPVLANGRNGSRFGGTEMTVSCDAQQRTERQKAGRRQPNDAVLSDTESRKEHKIEEEGV
jgi:hypothetical protein